MGIIEGLKTGQVPIAKYVMGGSIGALLAAAPVGGLGVLVGLAMYLPFSITLAYGLGCLIQMGIQKRKGVAFCEHKLVPFADPRARWSVDSRLTPSYQFLIACIVK